MKHRIRIRIRMRGQLNFLRMIKGGFHLGYVTQLMTFSYISRLSSSDSRRCEVDLEGPSTSQRRQSSMWSLRNHAPKPARHDIAHNVEELRNISQDSVGCIKESSQAQHPLLHPHDFQRAAAADELHQARYWSIEFSQKIFDQTISASR